MDLFSTLVVGLIAGWLASRIMGAGGYGLIGDIVVGVLGAFAGGWLAMQFLGIDVTGINVTSIAIAVVGAILLIAVFHALMPGRRGLGRLLGR
ncbi:MAG: GlsB/YeaQ/YmgE family stress response membrane protein [Chloroflexota bacterium]